MGEAVRAGCATANGDSAIVERQKLSPKSRVHGGYGTVFEAELFLSFEDGFLTGQRIVNNERIIPVHEIADVLTPLEIESEMMSLADREWRAGRTAK